VTFGRRVNSVIPRVVGRPFNDVSEELQTWIGEISDGQDNGLPPGFSDTNPTDVSGDSASSPGTEGSGWAAADHEHDLDTTGTPGNVTAAASFQGAGPGVSLSGHTHSIDNDAVTYAKIQNVSAASRLLGRGSAAGAGDVEELTLASGLSLVGTVLTSVPVVLRPAQITGNQNDYSPGTFGPDRTTVYVNTDASRNITGILATGIADGVTLQWINNGAQDEVLQHANAGSAAANQLLCPGAADLTVAANQVALIVRDGTATVWRVVPLF
jgi:hypothetical protein